MFDTDEDIPSHPTGPRQPSTADILGAAGVTHEGKWRRGRGAWRPQMEHLPGHGAAAAVQGQDSDGESHNGIQKVGSKKEQGTAHEEDRRQGMFEYTPSYGEVGFRQRYTDYWLDDIRRQEEEAWVNYQREERTTIKKEPNDVDFSAED